MLLRLRHHALSCSSRLTPISCAALSRLVHMSEGAALGHLLGHTLNCSPLVVYARLGSPQMCKTGDSMRRMGKGWALGAAAWSIDPRCAPLRLRAMKHDILTAYLHTLGHAFAALSLAAEINKFIHFSSLLKHGLMINPFSTVKCSILCFAISASM